MDTEVDTVDTGPALPHAVGHNDLAAQRDWEHYQRSRGIWRYRQSLQREVQRGARRGSMVDRALADLEPGQRIADDVILPLTRLIGAEQAKVHERYADPLNRNMADDLWTLLALPAEVLAVTTILSALSRTEPASLGSAALDLGNKVMREVELRMWAAAEKKAAADRKLAEAEKPAAAAKEAKRTWEGNLYELMVKRNDKVDERVFAKWSKKAALYAKGGWDHTTRMRVGTTLLGMLIEVDGWFETELIRDGAKTKLMFQLTDAARGWVAQRHHQNEMSRPFLLPMICEPRDYEYLITTEDSEAAPSVAEE
ncbi:hypothetical protein QTI51_09455 [Variovorax sp. J22G73]|uniref:hypothetical protein n=1 Tax=unclassified Variovorax TaxID=663243 RepID=UPI00257799A4|nr:MULTISPECIES: hypothetical protein [unclassified Variovorax]MDM0006474.1 hypothetical protein [Variovorax sp. J22R203]MDM0097502.1 hypothetical protein [Variovorax sp. J22G73]